MKINLKRITQSLIFIILNLMLFSESVKAISLSFTPTGNKKVSPGDSITFKVFLNPMGDLTFKSFSREFDNNELSVNTQAVTPADTKIIETTTIATVTLDATNEVKKDGLNDFFNVKAVVEVLEETGGVEKTISAHNSVDVPEPLTILGSLTALGIGAALKKKHSRKLQEANAKA